MKRKILIVYDCIYPESLGGVEHRNYQLSKYLSQKGYSITLSGWTKTSKSPLEKVAILPLPFSQSLYNQEGKRTALTSLKFALAILNLPLSKYDIILSDNIPYIHLFPLVLLSFFQGKKLVITWHEYWGKYWQKYIKGLSWILFFFMEFLAAQLGKDVICVSEFTAQRLQKNRLRKKNLKIIPNGVNLETIIAITKHTKKDAPPLIYAGRLMKEKRVNLLLEAIAKLNLNTNKIILQIIGDGPDRDRLEYLVKDLKIDQQVKFLGQLSTIEEVWQHLAQAKIAIQPSEREGFGMFPLEAMAVGTPVIYCHSQESAVSYLVRDGVEGIAVNSDSNSLAIAISSLLKNEEEWLRLSKNAQKRSKSFDWGKISDELESLFYELLD